MESHSLPLMLNILPIDERRSNVKEIENETGVVVVVVMAIGIGTGIGIVVIVIVPERQMTITTINHHGGGSMNGPTTTNIEVMISMPTLDGMKMSIVRGIVTGIGNPDQTGQETGTGIGTGTGTGTEVTETEVTETEEAETEKTETEETGIETEETEIGKGDEERETEETGIEETRTETETEETERNLFNHKSHHLVKARLLRRQQLVTLLDPSSKKFLLLTLTATVLYLHLQR